VKIETSIYADDVSLANEAIEKYVLPENQASAVDIYKDYSGYSGKLNIGYPWCFTYAVSGLPAEVYVDTAVLELSESASFNQVQKYDWNTDERSTEIYNLKVATTYYYRLNLTLSNGAFVGTNGQFTTKDTPRILNIEGAVNVRDIGGWRLEGGGKIRQGMLFRGSELDGAVEKKYCITQKGQKEMTSVLGVRYDMDLRGKESTNSTYDALGKNVVHKYYNAPMYSAALNEDQRETIKSIFSDLANKDNYPLYMHCTYGRDRTGTICYLLEALLGVSDKDMYKDYELSAFTDSYINTNEFVALNTLVSTLSGNTTKEKVEGYLLSIGVTPEEIASIREILIEK
jgi:hypothetical protein